MESLADRIDKARKAVAKWDTAKGGGTEFTTAVREAFDLIRDQGFNLSYLLPDATRYRKALNNGMLDHLIAADESTGKVNRFHVEAEIDRQIAENVTVSYRPAREAK